MPSNCSDQLRMHCEDTNRRLADAQTRPVDPKTAAKIAATRSSLVAFTLAIVAAKEHGLSQNVQELTQAAMNLKRQLDDSRGGLFSLGRAASDLSNAKRRSDLAQVLVDTLYSVAREFLHSGMQSPRHITRSASTPAPAFTAD